MSSTTTELTKQEQLELYASMSALEQFPSGNLITFLKANLEPGTLKEGVQYIIENMVSTMLVMVSDEIKQDINALLEKNETEGLMDLITGLVIAEPAIGNALNNALETSSVVIGEENGLKMPINF